MARYIANPVEVDAWIITEVGPQAEDWSREVSLAERTETVSVTLGMLARYPPAPGDYYVVQSDGYAYVNPKEVFESKYRKIGLAERSSC